MSISETKEFAGCHSAEKNLGIMRIPFLRLRLIAAFVTDMDTYPSWGLGSAFPDPRQVICGRKGP